MSATNYVPAPQRATPRWRYLTKQRLRDFVKSAAVAALAKHLDNVAALHGYELHCSYVLSPPGGYPASASKVYVQEWDEHPRWVAVLLTKRHALCVEFFPPNPRPDAAECAEWFAIRETLHAIAAKHRPALLQEIEGGR